MEVIICTVQRLIILLTSLTASVADLPFHFLWACGVKLSSII